MDYTFLLLLAVILIATKLFGLLTEKIHMPQVVGALLAGVILGFAVGFQKKHTFSPCAPGGLLL